jgi:hypothetical protein
MSLMDSLKFRYSRWRALRDASRTLPSASKLERAEIAELQHAFESLVEMPTVGLSAPEADWNEAMNTLRRTGATSDPRAFLRWDVVAARMAQVKSPATRLELSAMQSDPEWNSRWRDAIREVAVGSPVPYPKYKDSSEVLIQTAYHTRALERLSGRRVNEWDVIVEFGGGYGGLCRLMRKLGFRGRYVIFDLAPFTLLQRYYLTKSNCLQDDQVSLISDWDELAAFVNTITPEQRAVLWATWSLSEAPVATRERLKPLAERIGHYCIAFQGHYGDVDNHIWFAESWLEGARIHTSIGHRKDDCYLAGRTRT